MNLICLNIFGKKKYICKIDVWLDVLNCRVNFGKTVQI